MNGIPHANPNSQKFTVHVEPGDVFKVSRAGLPDAAEPPLPCSKEHTWQMFTVAVNIAGEELIQMPHEVSGIPFVRIMELRAAGDLSEVYVRSDDQDGHFAPPPEVRKTIYAAFGRLV